jgi:flagellar basal-body rod protein FlgB
MPLYHVCSEIPVTAPVYLFDLASRQAQWLAARQTTISGGHIGISPSRTEATKVKKSESWDTVYSKNSVSLEQELIKAGEVNRQHTLNTTIVKSFHRMLLTSVRTPS